MPARQLPQLPPSAHALSPTSCASASSTSASPASASSSSVNLPPPPTKAMPPLPPPKGATNQSNVATKLKFPPHPTSPTILVTRNKGVSCGVSKPLVKVKLPPSPSSPPSSTHQSVSASTTNGDATTKRQAPILSLPHRGTKADLPPLPPPAMQSPAAGAAIRKAFQTPTAATSTSMKTPAATVAATAAAAATVTTAVPSLPRAKSAKSHFPPLPLLPPRSSSSVAAFGSQIRNREHTNDKTPAKLVHKPAELHGGDSPKLVHGSAASPSTSASSNVHKFFDGKLPRATPRAHGAHLRTTSMRSPVSPTHRPSRRTHKSNLSMKALPSLPETTDVHESVGAGGGGDRGLNLRRSVSNRSSFPSLDKRAVSPRSNASSPRFVRPGLKKFSQNFMSNGASHVSKLQQCEEGDASPSSSSSPSHPHSSNSSPQAHSRTSCNSNASSSPSSSSRPLSNSSRADASRSHEEDEEAPRSHEDDEEASRSSPLPLPPLIDGSMTLPLALSRRRPGDSSRGGRHHRHHHRRKQLPRCFTSHSGGGSGSGSGDSCTFSCALFCFDF